MTLAAKKVILFDLDGTLIDSSAGITRAVQHALARFGVTVENRRELNNFIGPPLWESFGKYFGFTREQAAKAVEIYRAYYKENGIFENIVYEGIPDLLESLKSRGKTLIVATSKPDVFAVRILEHYRLNGYFTFTSGSELDGRRTEKSEVIRYALSECGIDDLSIAVMAGDREHDIIGAKTTGIASVGVLYGFGTREELTAAGADFIAEDTAALKKMLIHGYRESIGLI